MFLQSHPTDLLRSKYLLIPMENVLEQTINYKSIHLMTIAHEYMC